MTSFSLIGLGLSFSSPSGLFTHTVTLLKLSEPGATKSSAEEPTVIEFSIAGPYTVTLLLALPSPGRILNLYGEPFVSIPANVTTAL